MPGPRVPSMPRKPTPKAAPIPGPTAKPSPEAEGPAARGSKDLHTAAEYGRIFAAARAAKFPNAYQAARAMGLPVSTLYNIEAGARLPTWPTLHRLVVGLGLDPAALFPPAAGNCRVAEVEPEKPGDREIESKSRDRAKKPRKGR